MSVMYFDSQIQYDNKYSKTYIMFDFEKPLYFELLTNFERKYCKQAFDLITSTINNLNDFKISVAEDVDYTDIENPHTLCVMNDDLSIEITAPLETFIYKDFNSLSKSQKYKIARHILKKHLNYLHFIAYCRID